MNTIRLAFITSIILFAHYGNAQQKPADVVVKNPAYTQHHPKVLFDEAHHNWHKSSGRYKPFADLLTNDGYEIVPNTHKITSDVLHGYDIFICSNAFQSEPDSITGRVPTTLAFTAEECHAIKKWVASGGSLLLIADHEPAGNAVENLSDSLGVNMSKSYAVDPKNFDRFVFDASWIRFNTGNKNLANHPIIQGRNKDEKINNVLSFTGQSLKGPKSSVPILLLSDESYDVVDIEDPVKASIISAKGRCQGLALELGKGRIVIWGEAAMLTTQNGEDGINYRGADNKQLVINIAHWLSRLL